MARINYSAATDRSGLEKLISALLVATSTENTGIGGKLCKYTKDDLAAYTWANFAESTIFRPRLFVVNFPKYPAFLLMSHAHMSFL